MNRKAFTVFWCTRGTSRIQEMLMWFSFIPSVTIILTMFRSPWGKKNTALCSLKLYFQCCLWQQLLNSGSKFLPSAPHHSPDTHSFNSTSSGCLWSSLTVLKRQLSSGFQFLSCIWGTVIYLMSSHLHFKYCTSAVVVLRQFPHTRAPSTDTSKEPPIIS